MKTYSTITIMVGLVFAIITILFGTISTLLIYSLLMITTETKRYENGLMRVVGLSKWGYAGLILLQAVMFVIPSIVFGFISAVPTLLYVYGMLFTSDMGF